MTKDWNQNCVWLGIECLNRGQYFEAHEHWEQVWLKLKPKPGLQAMILFCGVGVLSQKARYGAALRLLVRAQSLMEESIGGVMDESNTLSFEDLASALEQAASAQDEEDRAKEAHKFVLEALGGFKAQIGADGLPRLYFRDRNHPGA